MIPAKGGCEDQKTQVWVCYNCLVAAASGKEEVTWNQATEYPVGTTAPATTVTSTNAYVIDAGLGHDYQPTYYRLSDKTEIPYTQTTCAVGFLVKYTCDVCGEVYTNVPVANDPDTKPEKGDEEDKDETNEAAVNAPGKLGFTDADGFIIYTPANVTSVVFQAEELAAALASLNNHQGVHSIQVATEYADRNGYVASTCVSTAIIPVVCENCGASLSYSYTQLNAEQNDSGNTVNYGFTINKGGDGTYSINGKDDNGNDLIAAADKGLNYLNHAGKAFDCGTHCDAYDAVKKVYICSGFDDGNSSGDLSTDEVKHNETVKLSAADYALVDHSTVTVDYVLASDSEYYDTYKLQVATFYDVTAEDTVVWSQAIMTDTTKLSKCSGEVTDYVMPAAPTEDTTNGGYKHANPVGDADSVYYLVLVSEDGKNIYPVMGVYGTGPKLYTDSQMSNPVQGGDNPTEVKKDETFYLSLDAATLKAPVYATNLSSLAKAISVAEVDKGVLTITLAEGVTFETIGRLTDEGMGDAIEAIKTAIKADHDAGMKSIVLDLNGSTIPVAADPTMAAAYSAVAVTVKNGAINYVTASNENTDNYFITLEASTSVTFDNVDINAGKLNGISVDPTAKLVMKDSSVTSYGTMGISVDDTDSNAALGTTNTITLTDTDIVMTKALPTDTAAMSTAMLVGAPVNVSVKGGEFSATMQALVVRGGNVTVSTTKLTVNAYTDTRVVVASDAEPEKNEVNFGDLFKDTSAVSAPWDEFVNGKSSVQTYRLAGLWGTGAEVARAAVVLGNNTENAKTYSFAATLRLDRVSWNVAEGAEKVVVGTSYHEDCYKTDNNNTPDVPTDDKAIPVVTLNATGSNLNVAEVVYTYNSYDGTSLKKADHISMVGLIPAAN